MSWGQVVETVEVLQESSQERDGTGFLHKTCINSEEEDDGHHQLRQQHSYQRRNSKASITVSQVP